MELGVIDHGGSDGRNHFPPTQSKPTQKWPERSKNGPKLTTLGAVAVGTPYEK